MRPGRLLRRPPRVTVHARLADDAALVASRIAAAFRPPYGATVPGGPPLDPPVWRIIGTGSPDTLVLIASSESGPPTLPIRTVTPIWSRLAVEGGVLPDGAGSVVTAAIRVKTPWWGVALLVAGSLLLGILVPLLLLPSLPVLAGAAVGIAAGALAVRHDQERALDVAPTVSRAIRDAAAGALPPAPPLPAWGPHDPGITERRSR